MGFYFVTPPPPPPPSFPTLIGLRAHKAGKQGPRLVMLQAGGHQAGSLHS